jgi:hypothetical protein
MNRAHQLCGVVTLWFGWHVLMPVCGIARIAWSVFLEEWRKG